jgi:hypothetical protein
MRQAVDHQVIALRIAQRAHQLLGEKGIASVAGATLA